MDGFYLWALAILVILAVAGGITFFTWKARARRR